MAGAGRRGARDSKGVGIPGIGGIMLDNRADSRGGVGFREAIPYIAGCTSVMCIPSSRVLLGSRPRRGWRAFTTVGMGDRRCFFFFGVGYLAFDAGSA